MPMMFGGDGAEIRAPMAITVIFGLSCSTLLTLLFIPVLYRMTARNIPVTNMPANNNTTDTLVQE
jgi:HAE1 family hydrophobic/amphiphilic exporter-1